MKNNYCCPRLLSSTQINVSRVCRTRKVAVVCTVAKYRRPMFIKHRWHVPDAMADPTASDALDPNESPST